MIDFGIQLFGAMEIFRKDPEMFFKRVAEMGYKKIEPCIWFGPLVQDDFSFHFWTVEELGAFSALMERYGLYMESFHGFGDLMGEKDEVLQVIREHDIKFIVQNTPDEYTIEAMNTFAGYLLNLAVMVSETGCKILVHNNVNDMMVLPDGRKFLEAVMEETKGIIGLQVDAGWMQYEGVDPMEFITKWEERVWNLHYKDICEGFETMSVDQIHRGLGQGILDYRSIFSFGVSHDLPQIVDQDLSLTDLMADLADSYVRLHALEG